MKLIDVIPVSKGITKSSLSYFTNNRVCVGSVVFVPLRSKTVPGIVTAIKDVTSEKEHLKSSSYAVKKIASNKVSNIFRQEFIKSVEDTADYFATTMGSLMHQIVPKIIFENIDKLPSKKACNPKLNNDVVKREKLIFQADEKSRLEHYKGLVREEFARNSSVFICIPTIRDAENVAEKLTKGIEKYVFVLHSEVGDKELLKRIKKVISLKHPVAIIGTGSFFSIPRTDIETIVVEKENSSAYKRQSRPFVDYRIFADIFANNIGAKIIFADIPLRVETLWKYKQKEYDELLSQRSRLMSDAEQYIIDMRPDKEVENKNFFVISKQLSDVIESSVEKGENTFIFNVRRGLAPSTTCEDCGSIVSCNKCKSPVVLHKSNDKNIFVCHKCGEVRSSKERCKNCKSWKLKTLGIGIERIKNELKEIFPNQKIFSIDSDSTKTYKKASQIALNFYKTPGSILVGTEMALPLLKKSVANSAVISIDSLLSLPDAKIYEHVFSILIKVRNLGKNVFFLQTRQPELSLIKHAIKGDFKSFYEEEIKMRKKMRYSPFTVLIKVTAIGTYKQVVNEMESIEKVLKKYKFEIYPAFTPIGKGKYALNGLIKLKSGLWPNKELVSLLRELPPNVAINVNPENTL